MKVRPLKRAMSLFLTLFLVLGLFPAVIPLEADAASQYITNIEVTSLTTSSAEISFHYGKNASGDDFQMLYMELRDAATDGIVSSRILRLTFSEGENWQGDYTHTFTGLSPETEYYAKIEGTADDKEYRSDAVPLTTSAVGTPQAELEVSDGKLASSSFVLKGKLISTGTGHTVDEDGHIYNPANEIVITRQRISVRNTDSELLYDSGWKPYQEELFTDSVLRRLIEVSGTITNPCTVTVELENSHEMVGQAVKTFNFITPPTLDSDNMMFSATDAAHFGASLAVGVSADPNDELISVSAARSGGTALVRGTWDSGADLYRFNFDGLEPETTYLFYIDALCASGRYTDIGGLLYPLAYTTPPAPTAPSVTTGTAEYLRSDGAKLGGTISSNGNANIVGRGFVYATVASGNNDPDTLIIDGIDVLQATDPVETQIAPTDFSFVLRGLPPGTGYYYRAYAISSAGFTQYGDILSFSTLSAPSVTTGSYSSVDTDSAVLEGEVISTGGVSPTLRGFVLSRQTNPTLGGDGVILVIDDVTSAATGEYDTEAAGLLADTTYYYKAYISNLRGTFYGAEQSFSTDALSGVPTVNLDIYNRPQTEPASKQVGATFTAPGEVTVTVTGFVYAVTEMPVIGEAGVGNIALTDVDGGFEAALTGLSPGTTYYYKAYATTDGDVTAYSAQGQFTTVAQPATGYSMPVITRTEVTDAAATTATVETDAAVTGPGAPLLFSRVLYYSSANDDPMPGGEEVTAVPANQLGMTGDGTTETSVTGLMADTEYYLRAVTQNEQGTYYGGVVSFRTDAAGMPVITNSEPFADSITFSEASVHADIEPCGAPVTSYGVVWSSAETEPLLGSPRSLASINTVSYSQPESVSTTLSGLSAGTTYYYRYYAENSSGISYGPVESFATVSADPPALSTSETIMAYRNWADVGMMVESDGTGDRVLSLIGVLVGDSDALEMSTPGVIVSSMSFSSTGELRFPPSGLNASTGYFVRAFGITQDGSVYYGLSVPFTTLSPDVPVTQMDSFVPVSDTSAQIYGSVLDDGGDNLTGRGFVYGTSPTPEIGGSGVTQEADSGVDLGGFSATLTNIETDTLYYVRAYASNEIGTGYSGDMLLLLQSESSSEPTVPIVETVAVANVTASSAMLMGEVVSDGGAPPVISRGFVYGTTTAPDRDNDTDVSSDDGIGSFSATVAGLSAGTTYYVRAYAVNEIGTAYGNEISFTATSSGGQAGLTVTTGAVSGIKKTGATFTGSVTAQGGALVDERGFVYGTATDPSIGDAGVMRIDEGGAAEGSFTAPVSGLTPGTIYHVRAYAISDQGEVAEYGGDRSFTTLSNGGGGGNGNGGYVPVEEPAAENDNVSPAGEIGYLDMPPTDNPLGNVILYTDPAGETHFLGLGIVEGSRMKYISRGQGKYEIIFNARDFDDIAGHWAKNDIDFSSARLLFLGVTDRLFAPEAPVTRGMFVTVIGRMFGADPAEYKDVSFDDVPQNEYYAPFVQWAAENGIVFGVSEDIFEPERAVTRQEMAAIMSRFMTFLGLDLTGGGMAFSDQTQIAGWAQGEVNSMRGTGILNGKPGNLFDPYAASTRAEVAAVIRRLIECIVNTAS